jgi:hypothetical protein
LAGDFPTRRVALRDVSLKNPIWHRGFTPPARRLIVVDSQFRQGYGSILGCSHSTAAMLDEFRQQFASPPFGAQLQLGRTVLHLEPQRGAPRVMSNRLCFISNCFDFFDSGRFGEHAGKPIEAQEFPRQCGSHS